MGSAPSRELSRSERQDELVKMIPGGAAKVIRRPKTNPDGSNIVTRSNFEFPLKYCATLVKEFCKSMGVDPKQQKYIRNTLRTSCGIDVDLEKVQIGSATSN
ncbi:uncharacterized protein LOC126802716 [Argentina anserina]|uniref:uncharacterized protein LOC126802716 n=1 Tax=Argentina anserina TaxID=57926 RepID=UPI0021765ECC|nr:uncharacterized protein LOC126802716 [Potentilla anserina]